MISSILLCYAQRTPSDFCRKELREKVGVKARFIIGVSHRKQNIGPTLCCCFYRSVIWCTRPGFFYRCAWQKQARFHCWITSLRFLSDWSQHTRTDFIANCRKERPYFLSVQKSAHTNWFSLRFFVYDRKIGPCALGIRYHWRHGVAEFHLLLINFDYCITL